MKSLLKTRAFPKCSLSTPVRITVPVIAGEDRNELFEVKITSTNTDAKTVTAFRGKTFIPKNATSVTINLTDILRNFKADGQGILEPRWREGEIADGYQLPDVRPNPIPFYISLVTVIINEQEAQRADEVVLLQDFIPSKLLDPTTPRLLLTDVTSALPHYPKGSLHYNFMTSLYNPDTMIDVNGHVFDNTPAGDVNISTPLIVFETNTDGLYVNGELAALYDECPSDYYLCWQVGASVFSYGFEGLATATRTYDRTEVVDTDGNINRVHTESLHGWKINSGFICDEGYQEAFDWLFRSKWVGLYETAKDCFHYVNVQNANFEWKTNRREMKNVEVEVIERYKYIN